MKSFIVIIGLFICITMQLHSQNSRTGCISGTVVDDDVNEPLIGATVTLHYLYDYDQSKSNQTIHLDEQPILGTYTDLDGKFRFLNIPYGKYVLIARFIGYKKNYFVLQNFQTEQTQVTIKIQPDEPTIYYIDPYCPAQLPIRPDKNNMNSISTYYKDQIIDLPVDK